MDSELSPDVQRELDLTLLGRALSRAITLGSAPTWCPMMGQDAERDAARLEAHGILWDASERRPNQAAHPRHARGHGQNRHGPGP